MIYTFLLFLHILVSILLVVVILLQSAKGGGLAGSAFGGAGGTSFLGARGTATFLSRATTILAVVFMVNSLSLSFLIRGATRPVSVTQQEIQTEAQHLPRVGSDAGMGLGEMPLEDLPATGDQSSGSSTTADESSSESDEGSSQ
jgi:preprotein translocase subunit SecG